MFDQMSSKETEIDEMKSSSSTTTSSGIKKTCSDCGTSKTPLWRGGPSGPKSLCNACGIRSRKRRRALLGLTNREVLKKNKSNKLLKKVDEIGDDKKEKMWCDVLGMEGLTWHKKSRGVIGEEEQAAVLLMAMAYSSVFA